MTLFPAITIRRSFNHYYNGNDNLYNKIIKEIKTTDMKFLKVD